VQEASEMQSQYRKQAHNRAPFRCLSTQRPSCNAKSEFTLRSESAEKLSESGDAKEAAARLFLCWAVKNIVHQASNSLQAKSLKPRQPLCDLNPFDNIFRIFESTAVAGSGVLALLLGVAPRSLQPAAELVPHPLKRQTLRELSVLPELSRVP
jgi:hypothetical protein